jgi:hypothetical protein
MLTIRNHHPRQLPDWSNADEPGQLAYFENALGEQWIARATSDRFRLAGGDIDWETRTIEHPDYEALRIEVLQVSSTRIPTGSPTLNLVLDDAERIWLAAVFTAARSLRKP